MIDAPRPYPFGLGTMALANVSPSEFESVVRLAVELGITHLDTANVYGDGALEQRLAPLIARHRGQLTVTTKVGLPMPGGTAGLSRESVVDGAHQSMRRLGVDRLDEFLLHRPDPATPIEDTLDGIAELFRAGDIFRWGCSTFTSSMLDELVAAADEAGVPRPTVEQAPYSIFVRRRERDVFPACRRFGLGVVAWSPLNGGWLTGKYRAGSAPPAASRGATPGSFVDPTDVTKSRAVASLDALAVSLGMSLPVMALAWCRAQPNIVMTLLGVRNVEQLQALAPAFDLELPIDAIVAIDAIVSPGTTIDARNDAWPPVERLARRSADDPAR